MLFAPRCRTIDVYSSPTTHFVVGAVGSGLFRVLFFERSTTASRLSDILFADPKLYDRRRLARLLRSTVSRTTSERRRGRGDDLDSEQEDSGLEANRRQVPVHQFRADAFLGAFRFLKGYYLLFVTERKRVGYINGHVVYSIESVKLFPITSASHVTAGATASAGTPGATSSGGAAEDPASATRSRAWSWLGSNRDPIDELEARYMSLFQLIDLTKGDFFFSYTLDLTNFLQSTFEREPVDDTFAWNDHLTSELRETIILDEQQRSGHDIASDIPPEIARKLLWTSDSWLIPLIHGSFQQQRFSLLGKSISVSLLARRSRYNAGTRYLKRGVNEQGKVANHVEVEQIVEVEGVAISSFVQMRGSIPTYWTQDTSAVTPKPPIKRFRSDPTFLATRIHFAELMMRYGEPIIVLNLVRRAEYEKSQRESKLGEEFADAVELLNASLSVENRIVYDAIDFKRLSKVGSISTVLDDVARKDLDRIGVFSTDPRGGTDWSFQKGVVRTNCIDCLDRTNVGQFCVGLCALGIQLEKLDVTLPRSKTGALVGPLLDEFVSMFESLGDRIAQQYGGSQAHKKGGVAPTSELLTSIRRYYNNSFNDRPKQDAMNLFLGWFVPRSVHKVENGKLVTDPMDAELGLGGPKALWDLENDFYLHNFRVTDRSTLTLNVDAGTSRWWVGRGPRPRVPFAVTMKSHRPPATTTTDGGGDDGESALAIVVALPGAGPRQRPSLHSISDQLSRIPSSASSLALMALSRSPSPPVPTSTSFVIRAPLADEEDSGVFVKFEKVFGDAFFKPIAIGAGNDEKPGSSTGQQQRTLRDRMFPPEGNNKMNESMISSTTAGGPGERGGDRGGTASDDEDESNATFSTNTNQRTGRLGSVQDPLHQFVASTAGATAASNPNSLLLLSSSAIQGMGGANGTASGGSALLFLEDDSASLTMTSSSHHRGAVTSRLLERSSAVGDLIDSFDYLGSVFSKDETHCADLELFREQAHIACHTDDAFVDRPVDPAIEEYMADVTVEDWDVSNTRRVIVESNSAAKVIPNGPFVGFKRGQNLSDLYSTNPLAGSVFAFEANLETTLKDSRTERNTMEEYLKHATL